MLSTENLIAMIGKLDVMTKGESVKVRYQSNKQLVKFTLVNNQLRKDLCGFYDSH